MPRGRELWVTAGCGVITLGMGNGGLTFAELWVPSGLASLFISTSPFWFVGLDALLPGGEPLHAPTLRGMLVGSAGVALLAAPAAWNTLSGGPQNNSGLWLGLLALQLSAGGWAFGSLLQRRAEVRAHPFISGAIGQLATGIVYSIPAALERGAIHWDAKGVGAILYLAIFGGIVGFSCFMLVMSRLPVAIASIYTYVNPVVALLLGWLVYGERVGAPEMVAMLVIFAGVAMVRRASRRLG
jgi:drug/metabolite transporter (DMT)-like permease